jgi:ATP-dependent DNA helicase PIF1
VAVVAAYGIVALNVEGVTLASWGGLGHDEALFSQEDGMSLDASALFAQIQLNAGALARWRTVTWLVIDEASLLSCELFDVLEEVARRIRGTDAFFGGIRLVMAFDFYQLFPVSTCAMPRTPLFMSRSWDSLVSGALCVELIEQHRFANDERLRHLCAAARHNSIQPDQEKLLRMLSRPLAQHLQDVAVTLAPHRDTVREKNKAALNALPGTPRAFPMHSIDLGPQPAKKAKLCMSVLAPPGHEPLVLKVGSLVMSPVNRRDVGLANGSVGRVTRFTRPTVPSPYEELPVVSWERGIGNREPFEETVVWLPVEPLRRRFPIGRCLPAHRVGARYDDPQVGRQQPRSCRD